MVLRHRSGVSRRALKNSSGTTIIVPQARFPPCPPSAGFDGLEARTRQTSADAARSGATTEIVVLDRTTGQIVSNGASQPVPIASVVKLFIADDLLLQEAKEPDATDSCRPRVAGPHAALLRRRCGPDLLGPQRRERHHRAGGRAVRDCGGTTAPYNGHWDVTLSTARTSSATTPCCWTAAAGCPEQAEVILGISRSRHRREPTGIRSGSGSRTGSTPRPSPSSRVGSAAGTEPTSCTCPPA